MKMFKNALMIIVVVCMIMVAACAEEVMVCDAQTEEITSEEIVDIETFDETVEEAEFEGEIVVEEQQFVPQAEEEQRFEGNVSICASCADTVKCGDTVTLYAVLEGYDGIDYHIQWQVSDDNSNWHDISGANGEQYSIVVSEENCANYYRIEVTR